MKSLPSLMVLLALSGAVPVAGWAGDPAPAPSSGAPLTLRELLKAPQQYANKTLTVTGRYGGMCSDGEDFYFKDHLSTIEVLLPPGGLPKGLKIGTSLRVEGEVVIHKHSGGEDEVGIKPSSVMVEEPAGPKS